MAINCDPATLANSARCFEQCIPPGDQQAVQTYLLAQIANSLNSAISTDPSTLAGQAAGFLRLKGIEQDVQLYLLCQIASASGA